MKDNIDIKEKKEEVFQLVKDAKQSYDDYYSMLGNELYDLDEKKREYEDCLKAYIECYGDITKEDDEDIYNDYVNLKEKEENNWKIKYLYLQADLVNIKNRYNKQICEIKKYEGEEIFYQILEYLDYLELKINNSDNSERLDDLYNRMLGILKMFDVKPIYDKRPIYFNPEYDNAILSTVTKDKMVDNTINKVSRKGYFYKDKILRYEEVIVNKYE